MSLARVAAVVRFEFNRTATWPRLAWWAVLALFPAVIVLLLVSFGAPMSDRDPWTWILFSLIPTIVCMLSLLLWATPIVHGELEGNTWHYLAVRPYGKFSVLFGKYVTAITWTALAGWTGLTISLAIARPVGALHTWMVMATLVLLSSVSYGALFTFLGVLVHKRPMVAAVAYALVLEFIVGFVPAMVNQFTVQFRLRTLLLAWTDWQKPMPQEALNALGGTGPAFKHVLILIGFATILLIGSAWLLRQKTLVTASDA